MACSCSIVPIAVLKRYAKDHHFPVETRVDWLSSVHADEAFRKMRSTTPRYSLSGGSAGLTPSSPTNEGTARSLVFDCAQSTALPGNAIASPETSSDTTVARTATVTMDVIRFYSSLFHHDSIDGRGGDVISSVHYGRGYNNAFWRINQMAYGDGDGRLFNDFTLSPDVICHELTHGITQFTAELNYSAQAGGLNESMSDIFGSMFRQWRQQQDVKQADWLIGAEIIGPIPRNQGITCLRDLANPAAQHCLAPQISHMKDFKPRMDPHESSGIANTAFYTAAMALRGYSWEVLGKIWYGALTDYPPAPRLTFRQFAERTRRQASKQFPGNVGALNAINKGWERVGL